MVIDSRAYLGKPIKRWYGFTCPNCQGSMRTRSTGRTNEGRYVVRAKKCDDCGHKCITAEVVASGSDGMSSIEAFDSEQRFAKRERRRKINGFHSVGCGHEKEARRIRASVRIKGGGKVLCGHSV